MNQKNEQGLNYIVQAINNIIDPKVETLKYDKTYRAKVTTVVDTGIYKVEIAGDEYQLSYSGTLNVGDVVRVKAPLNNFSDIYIEAEPGTGSGGTGTSDYTKLTNKPVLNTVATTAQATSASQIITGTITLHKISKTGSYNDLNDKPNLNFISNTQKGVANGVATLDENAIVPTTQLPANTVYDSNYTHINVVNNLTSTSTTNALSAAQGKALSDRVDANDTMIDTLQQDIIQTDDDVTKIKADYIPKGEKAVANGVATLDNNTKIYPVQLPIATVDTLGAFRIGNNLSMSTEGILSVSGVAILDDNNKVSTANLPDLPIASGDTLGAIKVGDNLNISTDGILSAITATPANVVDTLTSTSSTDALSANQGNVLNGKITANTNSISDLQENLITIDDNISAIQNDYIPKSQKGVANGIATLDSSTKITSSQIPIASETAVGGIKVGKNLTITEDGTLNVFSDSSLNSDTLPIGSVVEWYSTNIPNNWLICNGQAVSRTDYADLFEVLGTTYGEGDGSTTFNLPNMSGKFNVGLDSNDTDFDALGKTGGGEGHSHGDTGETELTVSTLPPYIVVYYIIKAKQTIPIQGTVVDTLTSQSKTDALSANQGRILNNEIQNIGKIVVSNTEPTDSSAVLWIDTSET